MNRKPDRAGFVTVIETPIHLPQDQAPAPSRGAAAIEYLRRHDPWMRRYPEQWRGWKEWRGKSQMDAATPMRRIDMQ